ncbi:MAG: diguanylate cyclase [Aquihabitans sp.]
MAEQQSEDQSTTESAGPELTLEQMQSLIERMPVGIMSTDANHRIVTANPGVAAIAGIDVIPRGADISKVIHPDDLTHLGALIIEHVMAGKDFHVEFRVMRPDGTFRWVRNDAHIDLDANGDFAGLTGTWLDITNLREADALLRVQATEDQLTGLGNRRYLFDELIDAIKVSEGGGPALSLLFVDLDGFKSVNDLRGHTTGDEVLKQVAQRIEALVRHGDNAARFGGDEFVIICRHDEQDGAVSPELVAERLITGLREPFEVGGDRFQLGASIGIADWRPGDTPDDLVRAADRAVYEVKRNGGGGWRRVD